MSFTYYRELIATYIGRVSEGVPLGAQLAAEQVLTLAAPVTQLNESTLQVDDPVFPFAILISAAIRTAVIGVIDVMRTQPVINVARLRAECAIDGREWDEAIEWMLVSGLILRSRKSDDDEAVDWTNTRLSTPLFCTHAVSRAATDVVLYQD